jgi:hypothetical protein
VPAGYTWHVGTLRDGLITNSIPTIQGSWSTVMDDAGTLSAVMPLADSAVAALNPYLTAEPCRCFLAVAYTDEGGTETFLAGGPIWTHGYDDTTQQLTIGAAGLWSYYDHRKILPVLSAGQSAASVTATYTTSLGTIAKRLVQLAHSHTGGSVPVALPADVGGTDTRTYPGFELSWVGSALADLTGVENGPEIQFVPRRQTSDPNSLEWVMRVGTTTQPLLVQSGADWVWDATVPRSSVSSVSVQRDGSVMGTRAWEKGAGSDVAALVSEADSTTLTTVGFPLLEVEGSGHEQVTVPATLNAYSAGLLASSARPRETWTVKIRRDEAPTVGSYSVGDWVSITPKPGPYLPNQPYRARILSIGGDDSFDVTLQLSPTLGGI